MTPDQLKQSAAAIIAHADGKPIEWRAADAHETQPWLELDAPAIHDPGFNLRQFQFRPKPWQLPTPPAGRQWHRTDFTEEMLPVIDGKQTRPLLKGEAVVYGQESGDEYRLSAEWHPNANFHWQQSYNTQKQTFPEESSGHWRTTRPLPSEPVTRPWSKPEDVPGPVCYLRRKENPLGWAAILGANPFGFTLATRQLGDDENEADVYRVPWILTAQFEHSTDRNTWHACTVTEPPANG